MMKFIITFTSFRMMSFAIITSLLLIESLLLTQQQPIMPTTISITRIIRCIHTLSIIITMGTNIATRIHTTA